MTKKQIEILVEHGDLLPCPDGDPIQSVQFITIKDEDYNLSEDIAVIISILYEHCLEERVTWSFELFKQKLDYKLQIYSTDKQDIKRLYNKMLLKENDKLDEINREATKNADAMEIELCYPLIPKGPYYDTANYFQVTKEFLSILKFDVFNGDKIKSDVFNGDKIKSDDPKRYKVSFGKLEEYFEQKDIIRCFEVEVIYKNISYLKELIAEIDNPEETLKIEIPSVSIENNRGPEENVFCKEMPISFAIEHFRVFEDGKIKSRNGKSFLNQEQLNSFIAKAFKGDPSNERLQLNFTKGEIYFIVKRFYQFYVKASEDYEPSCHCQEKYKNLMTDNFSNPELEKARLNFGNKVKREW